jgi:hypothetical protein
MVPGIQDLEVLQPGLGAGVQAKVSDFSIDVVSDQTGLAPGRASLIMSTIALSFPRPSG